MTVTTAFIIVLFIVVIPLSVLVFDLANDIKLLHKLRREAWDKRLKDERAVYSKINRIMDYLNLEEVSQESPIIRKRKT